MTFIKILQKILKLDLILRWTQMNIELDGPLPIAKNRKVIRLMKDKLGGKYMIKFVVLRVKTYTYLIDDGREDKKAKDTCVIKRKLEFKNYKNCLEATQFKNKINHLEKKNDIYVGSFFLDKRKHKEFTKNNKLILKIQQRFKSEKHDIFTEEIDKVASFNKFK